MTALSPYRYNARVDRIVDADTAVLQVDLGWRLSLLMTVRLLGMNAREHNEPGGAEATRYLAGLIPVGTSVVLDSLKLDKFAGRCDGLIWLADGRNVTDAMIAAGMAARWDGRGARPVPAWPIGGAEHVDR